MGGADPRRTHRHTERPNMPMMPSRACPMPRAGGRSLSHLHTHTAPDIRLAPRHRHRQRPWRSLAEVSHLVPLQHPLCGDRPEAARATSDSRCQADGRVELARVVDHILPVTGPDDATFFEAAGHQSLCATCHDKKRGRESHAQPGGT